MNVVITRSKKKDNKFDAITDGKKTVSFCANGMSDPERKNRYVNRHKNNENRSDQKTAGL